MPTWIYKWKYNGRESRRFQAEFVDSPVDGWIATFSDAEIHPSFKGDAPSYTSRYVVYLLSTRSMLVASFYFTEDLALQELRCDVSLPVTPGEDEIVFVDLELDLVVKGDNPPYLRDFQEFAQNRVEMGYTEEMVAGARSALLESLRLYRKRAFPFDGSARRILERELRWRRASSDAPAFSDSPDANA